MTMFDEIDATKLTKADRNSLLDLLQRAYEAANANPHPVDSDYFACCHAIGQHAQSCGAEPPST